MFVFFAIPLGRLLFPQDTAPWLAQLQVYVIFAAGSLARPLGGIVMAHYGDTLGRKRMFMLSVLLLAMHVLQGVAVGGEVPGAWVFVAEHVPPRRIGLACASLTAGLTMGIVIGSLVAAAINRGMAPATLLAWGWRLPFLLGGAFGCFALWLRRWLSETPVFEALRARRQQVAGWPPRLRWCSRCSISRRRASLWAAVWLRSRWRWAACSMAG